MSFVLPNKIPVASLAGFSWDARRRRFLGVISAFIKTRRIAGRKRFFRTLIHFIECGLSRRRDLFLWRSSFVSRFFGFGGWHDSFLMASTTSDDGISLRDASALSARRHPESFPTRVAEGSRVP